MAGAPFLPQRLAGTPCGMGWELRALTGRCPQTIPSTRCPCQLPHALLTTSSPGVHLQLRGCWGSQIQQAGSSSSRQGWVRDPEGAARMGAWALAWVLQHPPAFLSLHLQQHLGYVAAEVGANLLNVQWVTAMRWSCIRRDLSRARRGGPWLGSGSREAFSASWVQVSKPNPLQWCSAVSWPCASRN